MPSNNTFICVPCRKVIRREYWLFEEIIRKYGAPLLKSYGICPSCKGKMLCMGKHWSAPKKNNNRAWKRIANGDVWWNHYKVQRGHIPPWSTLGYRSNHRPNMGG